MVWKSKPICFGAVAPVGALLAGDALHQLPDECALTEWPVLPKPPRDPLLLRPTDGTDVWLRDGENRMLRPVCGVRDELYPYERPDQ